MLQNRLKNAALTVYLSAQPLDYLQMALQNLTIITKKGYIDRVITTNLTYLPSELYENHILLWQI